MHYKAEERLRAILTLFFSLTIFVACLGLFGLASFMAEQRKREIGVRKVLGASVVGILVMFLKDFIILVIIANLIAWPIAYYVMDGWLQTFVYRMDLGIGVFIIGGVMTLVIAVAAVAYQALKAAASNPVDALRCE